MKKKLWVCLKCRLAEVKEEQPEWVVASQVGPTLTGWHHVKNDLVEMEVTTTDGKLVKGYDTKLVSCGEVLVFDKFETVSRGRR